MSNVATAIGHAFQDAIIRGTTGRKSGMARDGSKTKLRSMRFSASQAIRQT